ncbi:MAG TPA: hypothetical protein VEF89_26995 [Solirubrobacteraceae bacterium]|nr:hypothetical protein [Solirubrobacteraceae bacterium]
MPKILTILAAAGAVAVALAFATTATGTSRPGTEHFSLINISTHESHTYSAIATGAFTAGGTAIITNGSTAVTLRFPNGTIKLSNKPAPPKTTSNASCLLQETSHSTYTILSGTGTYKAISGSGHDTSSATFVGAMVNGKCSNNTPATAIQIIDTATGPISIH